MIKSELLTELTADQAIRKIASGLYGGEEKHNGERRTVVKENGIIRDYNREGNVGKGFSKHQYLVNALLAHPLDSFVIDVEYEKGQLVVLDVLFLAGLDFRQQPYIERKKAAHMAFDNRHKMIRVCETVVGGEAILALLERVKAEHGEGIALKRLNAVWKPGRSEQHFKLKFWKSLDCIVIEWSPKGHNSAEVAVYDHKGNLHRICGVSLNGKEKVRIGDVIEIDYLYGTDKLEVVQPNLVRVRDDKRPRECTIDQIEISKNFRKQGM